VFPGLNGMLVVGNNGIVVVNTDGTGRLRLTRNLLDDDPAWSPSGTEIVFASDRSGRLGGISLTTPDGTAWRRLVRTPPHGYVLSPTWSPDGRSIAFSRQSDAKGGIYVMGVGRGKRRVTRDEGHTDTAWSPDGRWIAFSTIENRPTPDPDDDGYYANKEIHVVRPNGSRRRKVADGERPAWSPDGRSLVYVLEDGAGFNTYTVRADGTDRRLIAHAPSRDQEWEADWSPDGQSIVISRLVNSSGYRLYLVNADGSNLRRIPVAGSSVDWQRVTNAPSSFSDRRSGKGDLDLARLIVRIAGGRLTTTVKTWEPWRTSEIQHGRGSFTALYDLDLDGDADVTQRLPAASLSRPSATAAAFTRVGRKAVGVAVTSVWRDHGRCGQGCLDRIPDYGWLTARKRRP
jgi:dipeptidyl aminopeptidase/acylaminoacyl peptidase